MPARTNDDVWLGRTVAEGRYRVERMLGEGGMGAVYGVRDEETGAELALKVLLPQLAKEERHLARFQREAEVAGQLDHPHLVRVMGTGVEADGTPWMLMELVPGQTVSSLMKARGEPLGVPAATGIVRQVVAAISAAHQVGIVHRDLKPGNIMIVDDGGHLRVKVVDLGLARFVDTSTYQKLTMTGVVVGTPSYMAPEQAFGDTVDHRADLFSIGAVLHALLTGGPPFGTGPEVLVRLLSNERVRLTESRRDLGDIVEVIERCLEPEPEDRYQSAAALDAALAPFDASTKSVERWVPPKTMPSMVLPPDPVLDAPRPRKRPMTRRSEARPRAAASPAPATASSATAIPPAALRRPSRWLLAISSIAVLAGAVIASWFWPPGDPPPITTHHDPAAPSPVAPVEVPWAPAPSGVLAGASAADALADPETSETMVASSRRGPRSVERDRSVDRERRPSGPHSLRIEILESWVPLRHFDAILRAEAPALASCLDALPHAPQQFSVRRWRTEDDPPGVVHFDGEDPSMRCASAFIRDIDAPLLPSQAAELRIRVVREPVAAGEAPSVEIVDRTDWSARRRYSPRLRVTLNLVSGQLSTELIRQILRARTARLATCFDRAGQLYEPPPYRGQMEWSLYVRGYRMLPGHTFPAPVERCLENTLGTGMNFPYRPEASEMIRAEMTLEAARETSIVVVRRE